MEQPIRPVEPGQRDEDKDLLQYVSAFALVEIKKKFPNVNVKLSMQTWREPSAEIAITIPGTTKEWKEWQTAEENYRQAVLEYEADTRGVSVEAYKDAKRKAEEYNRKKCDKKKERDVEYYLENTIDVPEIEDISPIEIAS